MKRILNLICATVLAAGYVLSASAASTDGTATFSVTFADPPGGYSARVDAFWITDGTGKFIKNVRRDAATRQGYLYQWAAARTTTAIDGFSGATISTWTPVSVTWNCRDTNNVIVPDGTYRFYVEFTDHNGQGWYTTNGISFTKGTMAATTTYPNLTYLSGMQVVYTPVAPVHDIAVTSLSPSTAQAGTTVNVQVAVTNKSTTAETFSVVLSNSTSGVVIGTQNVTALAANASTTVSFPWTTPATAGNYSLRATAGPVTGETATADNSLTGTVAVQLVAHDVAVTSLTPTVVSANANVNITVGVANKTPNTESFSVVLSNLTSSVRIGTQQVNSLAGNATANLAFPWSTTNLAGNYVLQASAAPVSGEVATADNTLTNVVTVRTVTHDLALAGISAPAQVMPNSTAAITVTATNAGETAESFSVQLFDDTDTCAVGTAYQVANLAPAAIVNVPFTWNTTNATLGYHTLRAVANPVAGETVLLNNTNTVQVAVATSSSTKTFVSRGSSWRYNDQGLDLTQTPWRAADYYDAVWAQGSAPLGYSSNNQLTNLATKLSWGTSTTNKLPTAYFRQEFFADALPTSLALNVRRVHGIVLYLNGAELARFNMPTGAVSFSTLASSTVAGTARNSYFNANVATTNVVLGRNVLAAEVHLSKVTDADLAFDAELLGTVPQSPANHLVDAVGLTSPGTVVQGDQLPVTVKVVNRGNVTDTVLVLLKNNTTGQIIGSQTVAGLVPGGSTDVSFDWSTVGATNAANSLVAYTVVNGVTNLAGSFTGSAVIASPFSTATVNATGAIGGRCYEVATTSSLLLVGAGASLDVYSRSNTTSPVKLGSLRLPGLIQSIAVSGSSAYVACGQAGVHIVSLSNPGRPTLRSSFQSSGHAWSVAVSGSYLYVADGVAGLRVLNIGNPSSPIVAGAYYTEGPARAVAVSSSRAYLLDQQKGLLILSVSTPSNPTLLGTYANFDAAQALAVSGSYAYLLDGNNHFVIVDISNRTAPTMAGSLILTNMVGQGIAVNNGRVYIGAGANGLLTIDASTPSAPRVTSSVAMPGEAGDLAVANSRLYVADGFAGFQVFDLGTPTRPVLRSDYPTGLRAADVVFANNLAYVAAGEAGLRIFTVTNPANPALLGRFSGLANARAVAVSGSRAFVGDGNSVKIVNISSPSAPALLDTYTHPDLGSIRNIAVSGSRLVVCDGREVMLVDVSGSPVMTSSYNTPAFAFSLAVNNKRAYLACGNAGLIILNVGSSTLSQLGTLPLPSLATGVSVAGNSAYVASPANGWWTVDVSTPASPRLVQSSSAQGPILDLAVSGTNLTLITITNMAVTMNVSKPLTPVPVRSLGPIMRAVRVAASATFAMLAEDEAGLSLFQYRGGDDNEHDDDAHGTPAAYLVGNSTNSALPGIVAGDSVPQTSAVALAVEPVAAANSFITLRWHSEAGKTYTIYRSTDLNAGFTILKDNIPATAPLNIDTDAATNGAAFYIIGVR